MRDNEGQVHTGPYVTSPEHGRSIHAIAAVDRMEVGTYHFTSFHFTRVPSLKYDMDVCLHGNVFLEVRLGICVLRGGSSKK